MSRSPLALGLVAVALVAALLAVWRPWEAPDAREIPRSTTTTADPSTEAVGAGREEGTGGGTLAGRAATSGGLPDGIASPINLAAVDHDLDLHGVVVDGKGSPVPAAAFRTRTYPFRRASILAFDRYDDAVEGPSSRSETDGSFAIRLRRGAVVALRVAAAGFATVELPSCRAGENVKVVLRPGVRLVVEATTPEGGPASGVTFHLVRRGERGGIAVDRKGTTGLDGRVRFADLPPATAATLRSENSAWGDSEWQEVSLPESGETRVRIALPAGRTITGRVTDADTSAPIANARVGMNWTLHRSVSTDVEGRYSLPGWTGQGINDVHVLAEGYGRGQAHVEAASVLDFALRKGDSVTGRVLRPDRSPIGAAVVAVVGSVRREGEQITSSADGTTDRDGRFSLSGLRRDLPHTLVVLPVGFGRTLVDFDPRSGGSGTIDLGDIVVPLGRTVSGRVLTSDGEPVAGARLQLRGANADRSRLRKDGKPLEDAHYGNTEEVNADSVGGFFFTDLAPATYEVEAWAPGMASQRATVRVPEDADPGPIEIRFPRGRQVRVVVVDDAGVPVPWACVFVNGGSGPHNEVSRLDAQGAVSLFLPDSAKAIEVVTFWGGGSDPRQFLETGRDFAVDPKATEMRCTLVRGVALRGRVIGPDGSAVSNAAIMVTSGSEIVATATTGDEGRFDVTVPAEGVFTVRLEGWEETGGKHRELGLAGETEARSGTEVVLAVHRTVKDRKQAVQVLDTEGRGVEVAKVIGEWGRGAGRSSVITTDPDGRAELMGLPDLACFWVATPPESARDFLRSYSGPSVPGTGVVKITLRRGVRVQGRVVLPAAAAGSAVEVEVRQGSRKSAIEVGAGQTTFTLLLDPQYGEGGAVAARIGAQGAARYVAQVDIYRFGDSELVLMLEPVK